MESRSCLAPCSACGDGQLAWLYCELKLHEGDRVKEIVTFSRCRQQDTRVVFLVADSVHQKTDNPGRSVEQDEHLGSLLCIKSKDRPGEVPGLSNMLGDL